MLEIHRDSIYKVREDVQNFNLDRLLRTKAWDAILFIACHLRLKLNLSIITLFADLLITGLVRQLSSPSERRSYSTSQKQ